MDTSFASTGRSIIATLKAHFLGAVDVRFQPVVNSTNGELCEALKLGQLSRPTLLFTDEQTVGRGTRGRSWRMQPCRDVALTLAMPLHPPEHTDPRFSLALGGALALRLEQATGAKIGVKWPNDLLAGGSGKWLKVGGVLLETLVAPGAGRWLIAGVGINVNSRREQFPEDLAGNLTTLALELGHPGDRLAVLEAAADALFQAMSWRTGGPSPSLCEFLSHWRACDHTPGNDYTLVRDGVTRRVTATHIEPGTGQLVCVDGSGEEYSIASYTELDYVHT